MRILEKYPDGSQTVVYEPGDRVIILKSQYIGGWKVDSAGDIGTVIRGARPDDKHPMLSFLDVQSDKAKAGNWGTTHVPPWDVALVKV